MQQQPSWIDRVLESPLGVVIAGIFLALYLIGTLEERRQKREDKKHEDEQETPAFISEADKELWQKFREMYRQDMSNPDKQLHERLELLARNFEQLQDNVETLLDRTEPSIKVDDDEEAIDL